jgi:hypothetical protein
MYRFYLNLKHDAASGGAVDSAFVFYSKGSGLVISVRLPVLLTLFMFYSNLSLKSHDSTLTNTVSTYFQIHNS